MKSISHKEIMTPRDVMELLGISRSTLQRLKKKGDLIGYKFSNKIYFKRSEILATIEAGREEVQETAIKEAA